MKFRVDEAAASFMEELDALPDQLLQPAFRVKRQVKALHQIVRDLELPVASVLSLGLACIGKRDDTSAQSSNMDRVLREGIGQCAPLQTYTQVTFFVTNNSQGDCSASRQSVRTMFVTKVDRTDVASADCRPAWA